MESLSQRAAMLEFLEAYGALWRMEKRVRHRERLIAALCAAVVSLNIVAAAPGGLHGFDLVHYAIACLFALNLRRIVLDGIERRRDWLILDECATYARRRLAIESAKRRHAA